MGPQVEHFVGWPQFLYHLYPSTFCRWKNCRLKFLWLGWYPNPSTGCLAWLQEMANSGSISPLWGVLTRFISVDCWEFSLHLVSNLSPRCLPISVVFFSTLSLNPSHPDPFCFCCLQPHPPSTMSILFLLPREIHMFPVELFLLLTFSGAVECSMIIFYFIANIMKGGYIMLIFLGLVYLPQDEFFYSSIHLPENSWYHWCFTAQ